MKSAVKSEGVARSARGPCRFIETAPVRVETRAGLRVTVAAGGLQRPRAHSAPARGPSAARGMDT